MDATVQHEANVKPIAREVFVYAKARRAERKAEARRLIAAENYLDVSAPPLNVPYVSAKLRDGNLDRHCAARNVARYAALAGKRDVRLVDDCAADDHEDGYAFYAVTFSHNGATVTVRSVFDVQYHYGG